MRVLIADDDTVTRRLLESTLQSWGYEVCSASNGEEALQILSAENHPEMALIDWQMPLMDGPEVCRSVRSRLQAGPVHLILLTSVGGEHQHHSGIAFRGG